MKVSNEARAYHVIDSGLRSQIQDESIAMFGNNGRFQSVYNFLGVKTSGITQAKSFGIVIVSQLCSSNQRTRHSPHSRTSLHFVTARYSVKPWSTRAGVDESLSRV